MPIQADETEVCQPSGRIVYKEGKTLQPTGMGVVGLPKAHSTVVNVPGAGG